MAQPSNHILDLILNRQAQLSAAPVRVQRRALPALQARVEASREHSVDTDDPFAGMQRCRDLLKKLDGKGWERSYHQRLFHEDFLRACTKTFYKRLPRERFARDHRRLLVDNSWDNIAQEILVSTPRRFGKTISVSMFAAALIAACPAVEISIYSTCKRISQKLLRNVTKFVMLMSEDNLHTLGLKVVRQNMEELVLGGIGDSTDIRIVNSYPSKVGPLRPKVRCSAILHASLRLRVRLARGLGLGRGLELVELVWLVSARHVGRVCHKRRLVRPVAALRLAVALTREVHLAVVVARGLRRNGGVWCVRRVGCVRRVRRSVRGRLRGALGRGGSCLHARPRRHALLLIAELFVHPARHVAELRALLVDALPVQHRADAVAGVARALPQRALARGVWRLGCRLRHRRLSGP